MSQMSFDSLFMNEPAAAQSVNPSPVTPPRLLHPDEARREFIRVFRHTAPYMRRLEVFRDFVSLAARELDMARIRPRRTSRRAAGSATVTGPMTSTTLNSCSV